MEQTVPGTFELAFDMESLRCELARLDRATLDDLINDPSRVVFDLFVSHHTPAVGASGAHKFVVGFRRLAVMGCNR